LSALVVCGSLVGCERSSESEKREADKAAAEAEKKQTQVVNEADQNAREAREKVERERGDLHAAVLREKVEYRSKLHDALDRIDKDLAERKIDVKQIKRGDRSKDATMLGTRPAKDQTDIQALLNQRDRVMDLTDEIDKTSDQDWPNAKQRIDRELKDQPKPGKPGRT
jgi:hypothetical protein